MTEFTIPTAAAGLQLITAGPDGNLWFTEFSGNRIGRITPAGVITEFPIPTANSSPIGVTAGPDGNVWFTGQSGHKIGRFTPAFLAISPRSGFLSTTQGFDLPLTIDTRGLAVAGGTALFDGADIGAALLPAWSSGRASPAARPSVVPASPAASSGPGVHTMTVTPFLSDGSVVSDMAEWHVQANTEP